MPGFTKADLSIFDRPPPSPARKRVMWVLRTIAVVLGKERDAQGESK
jgi:hypothetical protein